MTRVIVDRNAGFCAGVRRAIRGTVQILNAAAENRVAAYGQLVHNQEVTEELAERGLLSLDRPEDANPGDEVIVRTHGISPKEEQALLDHGAAVTDFTCPRVERVHRQIREKRAEGYDIVIVGDPDHPEVRAHLGHAGDGALVLSSAADARRVAKGSKIAVFAQTTIIPDLLHAVTEALSRRDPDMIVVNSLCPFVEKRQRWIVKHSRLADASLILGGRNSSNTRKLHALARANGPALHVSRAAELDVQEVMKHPLVALTAGASTSDRTIREVLSRLQAAGARIEYR
jgi:4-hydroxy-3-methylbut-2-enyl diphosphate reductase